MNIKPLGDHILIEPIKEEEKSKGKPEVKKIDLKTKKT